MNSWYSKHIFAIFLRHAHPYAGNRVIKAECSFARQVISPAGQRGLRLKDNLGPSFIPVVEVLITGSRFIKRKAM